MRAKARRPTTHRPGLFDGQRPEPGLKATPAETMGSPSKTWSRTTGDLIRVYMLLTVVVAKVNCYVCCREQAAKSKERRNGKNLRHLAGKNEVT